VPPDAVVATDSASADADWDNGATLRREAQTQLRDGGPCDGMIGCLIAMESYQCEHSVEHSSVFTPNATTGSRFIVLVGC
jgi:hypothetical protein